MSGETRKMGYVPIFRRAYNRTTMAKTPTLLLSLALLALPFGVTAQDKPAPEEMKKPAPRVDYRRFDFSRCVVKPVMSDDDLRRCGATPTQPQF